MTDMNLSVGSRSGQAHEDTGGQLKQFRVPEQSSPGVSLASLSPQGVCVCGTGDQNQTPVYARQTFYHEAARLALIYLYYLIFIVLTM